MSSIDQTVKSEGMDPNRLFSILNGGIDVSKSEKLRVDPVMEAIGEVAYAAASKLDAAYKLGLEYCQRAVQYFFPEK